MAASKVIERLFEYDDYRKFLQDYFEELKNQSAVFSHRFFAAKADFKTSSYCLNVIRGRLNASRIPASRLRKSANTSNGSVREILPFNSVLNFSRTAVRSWKQKWPACRP